MTEQSMVGTGEGTVNISRGLSCGDLPSNLPHPIRLPIQSFVESNSILCQVRKKTNGGTKSVITFEKFTLFVSATISCR